jgi:hypothetical protein
MRLGEGLGVPVATEDGLTEADGLTEPVGLTEADGLTEAAGFPVVDGFPVADALTEEAGLTDAVAEGSVFDGITFSGPEQNASKKLSPSTTLLKS